MNGTRYKYIREINKATNVADLLNAACSLISNISLGNIDPKDVIDIDAYIANRADELGINFNKDYNFNPYKK